MRYTVRQDGGIGPAQHPRAHFPVTTGNGRRCAFDTKHQVLATLEFSVLKISSQAFDELATAITISVLQAKSGKNGGRSRVWRVHLVAS